MYRVGVEDLVLLFDGAVLNVILKRRKIYYFTTNDRKALFPKSPTIKNVTGS